MSLSKEFADLDFPYMRKVAGGMAKHVRNMSAIEQLMSIAIVAGATLAAQTPNETAARQMLVHFIGAVEDELDGALKRVGKSKL